MKKIVMTLLVVVGLVNATFAQEWIDRNKIPATVGSAEQFAIDYLKMFVAGNEDNILNVCEDKLKAYFSEDNRTFLKSRIKRVTGSDLSKKLDQRTNPEANGVIKIEMKIRRSNGRKASFDVKLKKLNNSYQVLMN